jgi:acetyl esterase
MPLDPTLQMMLDNAKQSGRSTSLRDGTVEEARLGYEMLSNFGGDAPDLAADVDRTIPGPAGDIPIRVYTPLGEGPFPILVFFHGGGFTIGSINSHDPVARQLAAQTDAVVVSVDYRLAPENAFPAGVDDAFAATRWVAEHAAELNGDPNRIAVCGDSAGGNLSAVVSLLARDAGGPAICFQALIYPATDARGGYASLVENGEGLFLTADTMAWFQEQYLGSNEEAREDIRVSPLLAHDLSGLPPAFILTAEYDPLRDEGEAYGDALRAAGNSVTVKRYDGMAHIFIQLAGVLEGGRTAITDVAGALRDAFQTERVF